MQECTKMVTSYLATQLDTGTTVITYALSSALLTDPSTQLAMDKLTCKSGSVRLSLVSIHLPSMRELARKPALTSDSLVMIWT